MHRAMCLLGIALFLSLALSAISGQVSARPTVAVTAPDDDADDEITQLQPSYSGLVTDPWGFRVQLDAGLVGHLNGMQGTQGHGMWVPVETLGDTLLASIEFFAAYNSTLEGNPACLAKGMLDKSEAVLESGPVSLGGFDGWQVLTKAVKGDVEWRSESLSFLRFMDMDGKINATHYKPELLKHSFENGCDYEINPPHLEYVLTVRARADRFAKARQLFRKTLKSWEFVPTFDR